MNRPLARPLVPEDNFRRVNPSVYLARAAAAHLRSFVTGGTPRSVAKTMFNDTVTEVILQRAATGPAAISGTQQWAASHAGVAIYDMIQSITSLSAAAEVIDRALKLNMDGVAEYRVPGRALTASAAWVTEGGVAPVRSLSFSNAAVLRPRKLEVLCPFTREMAESSNIEAIVRATLGEQTGLALDLQMFSADPGDGAKPPGLFQSPALTPVTGGGDNAMHGDLANLFAALAAKGGGKTAAVVAAMPQTVRLKSSLGPLWDYPIIGSTALAPGTVAVVEVASLVSGFGTVVEFSTGKYAAVHMEDTAPADFPAAPMKSMFQIDSIVLKAKLSADWGLRAVGHCQYLTGATW